MGIALCLIATNKYKQFVQPLVDSVEKNFLRNHNITIHLFTDDLGEYYGSERVKIEQHLIPSYKFPEATLLRYKIFTEHADEIKKSDYTFYLDVDMRIDMEVGDEILEGEVTAVLHPGFFTNNGWGSPNVNPLSKAYINPRFREKYYAGGFQGGKTKYYLFICRDLAENIEIDRRNSLVAEWHDESHWNAYLNFDRIMLNNKRHPSTGREGFCFFLSSLTPSYCMVEQMELREKWGIANLDAKIVALNKNHEELRS